MPTRPRQAPERISMLRMRIPRARLGGLCKCRRVQPRRKNVGKLRWSHGNCGAAAKLFRTVGRAALEEESICRGEWKEDRGKRKILKKSELSVDKDKC